MPDPNVTREAAIGLVRGLSGTENYPFHIEGEDRLARILMEHCAGVMHARLVIEEFDESEKCPTVEALRAAAWRLAEVCECGKPKWQHRDKGACARFNAGPEDEEWTKTDGGFTKFRQSVPMIPGVPWEVALQVQTLKIGIRSQSKDKPLSDDEMYPEACAAIRAGREPDYKLLESQMRAMFPHMWKRSKGIGNVTTTERVALLEKNYAVESITPES